MKAKRRSDLDIALEDIECPNTFDDDPRIDSFFETVTDDTKKIEIPPVTFKESALKTDEKKKAKKSVVFKDFPPPRAKKTLIREKSLERNDTQKTPVKMKGTTPTELVVEPQPSTPEIQTTPLMLNTKPQVELRKTRRSCRTVARNKKELAKDLEEKVEKHVLGRWSFPAAGPLINVVEIDDVKPMKTTPLRGSKKKARKSSLGTMSPRRRKSTTNPKRMSIPRRDSLRKLSLMRNAVKRKSRIPIKNRNSIQKIRTPVQKPMPTNLSKSEPKKPDPGERPMKSVNRSFHGIPTVKPAKTIMKATQKPPKKPVQKETTLSKKPLAELFKEYERGARFRSNQNQTTRPPWR